MLRKIISGRGPDSNGGVGDSLHSVCVRSLDGVHGYPTEDEAEEALQLQEEEGQLRRD